jgi:hypothetical protein
MFCFCIVRLFFTYKTSESNVITGEKFASIQRLPYTVQVVCVFVCLFGVYLNTLI